MSINMAPPLALPVLAVLLAALCIGCVAVAARPADRVQCVAHRGFSAVAPENTLAAVRKAIEAGADGCEFDVRASRDGVAVLMHDAKVDRTTNAEGGVGTFTAEELQHLDAGSWKGEAFAGEPVPTLLQVLRAMKGTGCTAVVEVKQDGIAKAVVDAVRGTAMGEATVVISFSDRALEDVHGLDPKIPCALLVGGKMKGAVAEWAAHLAERAKTCGATLLDLHHEMLSPELIADLNRRGLAVWCWTVNDPDQMKTLAAWGVEAVTTDRPDLMAEPRKRDRQNVNASTTVSEYRSWKSALSMVASRMTSTMAKTAPPMHVRLRPRITRPQPHEPM